MTQFPELFGDTANANIHTIYREIKGRFDIDATITLRLPKAIFTNETLYNTIHVLSYKVQLDNNKTK